MEDDKKVIIENLISATVGINIPDLRLNRTWEKKGAKKIIPFGVLKEAIYDPGTEYLFKEKILYIEDKEVRVELGLEEADSKEEYVLSDAQKERLLKKMPASELKITLPTLSVAQIEDLIDYAVEHEVVDFDRADIIKQFTKKDIIQMIKMQREKKEV